MRQRGRAAVALWAAIAALGCDDAAPEPSERRASPPTSVSDAETSGDTSDPRACFERARGLITSNMKNPRALPELECACDGGVAEACTHLGAWHRDGIAVSKNDTKATAYYKRGCDLGDGWGCSDYGVSLSRGRGVPRDMAASHKVAKRACELKSAKGCSNAGMHLMFGRLGKQDFAAAAELLARGCRLHDQLSCRMETIARDPERARAAFTPRCNAGSLKDCHNLAMLSAPTSQERQSRLKAACDGGHAQSCKELRIQK